MDAKRFGPNAPGRLVPVVMRAWRQEGSVPKPYDVPTAAFVPNPLPPRIDWRAMKADLFNEFAHAQSSLGRLNGLVRGVTDAKLLLRGLWVREAKLSSAIENIHTTAGEMMLAAQGRDLPEGSPAREAWNYVRAMEHGLSSQLPFCARLICEMHALLLDDVRGADKLPCSFRDGAVYIGDARSGPARARFIPPPAGEALARCITDLERFANAVDPDIPTLAAVAMVHYQFEAIHPFRDGNGRIGRVLIVRSLCKDGMLDQPVAYVSGYIHAHKREYMDLLLRVSTEGAWEDWIRFMLAAIATQADDAVVRCERLVALRRTYHQKLQQRNLKGRTFRLVDGLFSTPIINAKDAARVLEVSDPTARSDISTLVDLGILSEVSDRRWGQDWAAHEVLDVIERDSDDSTHDREM